MIESIYLCPSTPSDKCQWEGKQEEVLPHFEKCHKDFFLNINHFNLELNRDSFVNYLMHLNGETYLVQFKYSKFEDVAEIRLRFLGTLKKAQHLSYYVEIDSGNFAFTTRNHSDGYSLITRREGAILIDISGIRTICGRRVLDNVVCFINIEGETNSYVYRSIRRSFHDSKMIDSKVREIFQRNSSFRSSIRRKSTDGLDFVEAYRKRSSITETPPLSHVLINEILDEIIDGAVEESESKNGTVQINEDPPRVPNDSIFDDDFFEEQDFDFQTNFLRRFNSLQEFGSRIMSSFSYDSASLWESSEFCIRTELESIQEHEIEHVSKISRTENDNLEKENKVAGDVMEEPKILTDEKERSDVEMEDQYNFLTVGDFSEDEVVLRPKPSKLRPNRLSRAETEYYEKIQLMRCENCSMIMIPPIYVCLNGHSVCINCKPLNCSCKSEVTDMRNIDLEEISRSLTHPCRFLEKGCTELHSCYDIRFHEIKCDYFQYKCPQCAYVGKFNEVINHVRLLHPSLRVVEDMENPFPRNSDFLVANKFGIFYCTAFIYDNSIEWCVVFSGREKISFSCVVSVKTKKNAKVYQLKKNGNTCKSIIHLNELKNSRVKDKNAVLHIRTNS